MKWTLQILMTALLLTSLPPLFLPLKADHKPKTILVILPSAGFDRSALKEFVAGLQHYQIIFTIPRSGPPIPEGFKPDNNRIVPNGVYWGKILTQYIPWEDLLSQPEIADALVLWGGQARLEKSGLLSSVLREPSLFKVIQEFHMKQKTIVGFSHGIEAMADAGILKGKKITGPGEELIRRTWRQIYYRRFKKVPPVIAIQKKLMEAVGLTGAFHPGPSLLHGRAPKAWLQGSVTIDENILTAASSRSAELLAKELDYRLKNPNLRMKSYDISIFSNRLNIRVEEFLPTGSPLADHLIVANYADHHRNYRPGYPMGELVSKSLNAQLRTIVFDWPGHGDTHGILSSIDLFNFRNLSRVLNRIERKTKSPDLPLVVTGISMGADLLHRIFQYESDLKNHSFSFFTRKPKAIVSINPNLNYSWKRPWRFAPWIFPPMRKTNNGWSEPSQISLPWLHIPWILFSWINSTTRAAHIHRDIPLRIIQSDSEAQATRRQWLKKQVLQNSAASELIRIRSFQDTNPLGPKNSELFQIAIRACLKNLNEIRNIPD